MIHKIMEKPLAWLARWNHISLFYIKLSLFEKTSVSTFNFIHFKSDADFWMFLFCEQLNLGINKDVVTDNECIKFHENYFG